MAKKLSDCYSETFKIELGGKIYNMGKIDVGDTVNFQKWCDKQAVEEVIEICKMMGREPTIKELRDVKGDSEYQEKKSNSLDGATFLILEVIKRLNEDVDEEEIRKNLTVTNLIKLSNQISESDEISKLLGEDDQNFPEKKKTTQKKSQKKKV